MAALLVRLRPGGRSDRGRITSLTTPGGHRRFHWSGIEPFLVKE